MTWAVDRRSSSPAAFHQRVPPDPLVRAAWVCDPVGSAVVLGSTQADRVVDERACAEAGVEVVRRRSGGGAVLVTPGDLVWLDLLIPSDDPLWSPDVGAAFGWVGALWVRALAGLDVDARAHVGPPRRSRWSDLVCFAGLGPGEVTVGGRKVVGISQRRTRAGARFQCAALLRWDAGALLALLALEPGVRRSAAAELADSAAGLRLDPDALLASVLRHLP